MCGRFTLFVTPDELEERFGIDVPADWTPSYNVAPGEPIATVDAEGECRLREWGFVPHWADDPDDGGHVNARAESIEDRSSFEAAVERRRCLVPADGFYEWTDADGRRQPHRIAFDDDRTFAMAGVWERWEGQRAQVGLDAFTGDGGSGDGGSGDGGESDSGDGSDDSLQPEPIVRETVAVITTAASDPVAELHDRMPVVLPADREHAWLDADGPECRARILSGGETTGLRTHPVSTAVNDPGRDSPDLIEPVES